MLATDILLSIAIVGIYTLVHVYLRTNYNDKKKILTLFPILIKDLEVLIISFETCKLLRFLFEPIL